MRPWSTSFLMAGLILAGCADLPQATRQTPDAATAEVVRAQRDLKGSGSDLSAYELPANPPALTPTEIDLRRPRGACARPGPQFPPYAVGGIGPSLAGGGIRSLPPLPLAGVDDSLQPPPLPPLKASSAQAAWEDDLFVRTVPARIPVTALGAKETLPPSRGGVGQEESALHLVGSELAQGWCTGIEAPLTPAPPPSKPPSR